MKHFQKTNMDKLDSANISALRSGNKIKFFTAFQKATGLSLSKSPPPPPPGLQYFPKHTCQLLERISLAVGEGEACLLHPNSPREMAVFRCRACWSSSPRMEVKLPLSRKASWSRCQRLVLQSRPDQEATRQGFLVESTLKRANISRGTTGQVVIQGPQRGRDVASVEILFLKLVCKYLEARFPDTRSKGTKFVFGQGQCLNDKTDALFWTADSF